MFEFGLSETVLHIVRIIASVGGAVVGWFVTDPLARLLYRVSFRGATPGAVLFGSKSAGAAMLSLLIYFFMPLGGGGGGFGWGPGQGGTPGKGPGSGGDKTAVNGADKTAKPDVNEKTDATPKSSKTLEPIEIEIISRDRFEDDGKDRFYLLKRAQPALSLAEVKDYLTKTQAAIEVTPVLTRDSVPDGERGRPLSQLLALTKDLKIKTLQTKGP